MNRLMYGFLVVLTTFLMGSTFAIGKIGLAYASPLLLASLRFIIAGIVMALAVKISKRPHPKSSRQWLQIAVVGFFQTAAVMGCIFVSLRTITSGESAILTFTNPLLVVLFGTVFMRAKYRLMQWLGVLLGFLGVFITMGGELTAEKGTFLGIMSAVAWAFATLLIKKWGGQLDTWVLTAYQMLFGGFFLLIASFFFEHPVIQLTIASAGILAWLAFMGSIVQFAGWFYLLQTGDPGKTSAFLFLAPFFGVLSGWILLGEKLHFYILAGGALIFAGIFLVNWQNDFSSKRK
ncbi:DMT family transporter [Domibacillus indicus]|uniref:DMT family transporter n=1 Tax=Domibacillus indicus TaxID=1437523 RepID=UPI000617BB00|nr:EamA family transporter [Domibacillus indicus]